MEALALIGDLGLNVVDDKEIARCKEMFTLYDEDKDGKLTYAELLTCVRCCGRNPSVDEFKEMVQVIDTKLVRGSESHRPWSRPHVRACPFLAAAVRVISSLIHGFPAMGLRRRGGRAP